MAGVIGASGCTTIRSPTMAERSRMQGHQQKEEVEAEEADITNCYSEYEAELDA
jgi:hypothetical protein